MLRLGLTGGIGSGKSTVARMLAERGAVVIDADAISRQLVEPGEPALDRLVEEFGPRILREDGSLDRGALAQAAFGDAAAAARLNEIMHPAIRAESERRIADAVGRGATVVVYDMPLLVETGQQEVVDRVLVVDVPEAVQLERAVGSRGLDESDVRRRMALQASREERLRCADGVIDNSGDVAETERQVDALWRDWAL